MRRPVVFVSLLFAAACGTRAGGGDVPPGDGGPPADLGAGHDGGTPPGSIDILGPGAPPDAPSRFGGPSDGPAPTVIYPNDGTMVPPNLEQLELHYDPGSATLVDFHFSSAMTEVHLYVGCPEAVTGGCIYLPDHGVWTSLSNAFRGQGEIHYELRAVTASGHVGVSASRAITFAETDVTGGIYYWAARTGKIMRFEFGVPGAREETFLDPPTAGASMCIGCHSLSRDGSRISVDTDLPTTTFATFDVTSRSLIFRNGPSGAWPSQPNYSSWAPDDSQIVQSTLDGLKFIDAASGTTVADHVLPGMAASMPDWSPDGTHVVFAQYPTPPPVPIPLVDLTGIEGASIALAQRDATGGWTQTAILAATGSPMQNNYYPAFSPDGRWVVFINSPSNTSTLGSDPMGGMMGGVPDARLMVVPTDMSAPPTYLSMAAGASDSWPKWNPSEFDERGRPIFWLAWSSRRGYGLRYTTADDKVQLWMTAFDPSRASSGAEPAYPAFRLPFQASDTGNHIPQWVTTVHRETCTTDADCGGEFCVDGRCYQTPPLI